MSNRYDGSIRNIFTAIEKFMRDTKYKKNTYVATHNVLEKIKKILEHATTTDKDLICKIGKERFRRVLLHLASILHVLQRHASGDHKYLQKISQKTPFEDLDYLTIELICLEVDLTPDLILKRQRLLDILDKSLYKNVNRTTQLRLRSQFLETNVTLKKRAALLSLYTTHGQIVDMYQRQCLIEHSSIKLGGLENGIQRLLRNVNYKDIPHSVQCHLKSRTLLLELSLKNTYVHLKADPTSTYERSQAQKLLHSGNIIQLGYAEDDFRDDTIIDKDYDQEVWKALEYKPIMPSLMKHHNSDSRQNAPNIVTVLQRSRWTVVLGDPGSGKTTFVRWMVRTLISSFLSDQVTEVSLNDLGHNEENRPTTHSYNHDQEQAVDFTTNLGIKQLPLLVRVGEFAEALENKPELTLYDYLGEHTWMGNSALAFPADASDIQKTALMTQFKLAIQDYIKHGCAFVILDGLDEIPAGTRRRQVVKLIEDFVHDYIRAPDDQSVFDEHWKPSSAFDESTPITSGGNQILITSRIVGYHVQPLHGNFAHFTINPLEIAYIQQFIHYWSKTISSGIIKLCNLTNKEDSHRIETQAQTLAHSLETQIDEKINPSFFNLATNPSLLNLLCTIAFQNPDARLPEKRVCLYYETTRSLVNVWEEKNSANIPWQKFNSVLGDVAAHIHENSASGLIEEFNLKRICKESVRELHDDTSEDDLQSQVNQYFEAFRANNGVLLQRGQYLYGFSHLTFQEYYACINMLNTDKLQKRFQKEDKNTFTEQLVAAFNQHLADIRYRVILSLCLGWLSWKIKSELNPFCEQLLESKNVMNQHLPLAALLLMTSIRDLVTLPSNTTLVKTLNQLLTASVEYRWYRDYVELQREMAAGINNLPTEFVCEWIMSNLCESSLLSSKDKVFALCHVLVEATMQLKRKKKIKSTLQDNQNVTKLQMPWSTPTIYEKLTQYLEHDNEEWEYAVDSLLTIIVTANPESIFTFRNSLREIFISNPTLLKKCHPLLITVVIALYGGIHREENHNVHSNVRYGRHRPAVTYKIGFSPLHMHRESVLTPIVQYHLSNPDIDSLCAELILYLKQIQSNDTSLRAVDSFIALFCVQGVRDTWLHEQFFTFAAYQAATKRFKRILVYLRQFYFMYEDLGDVSITSEEDDSIEQEDFDIDLQQIITDLLSHLKLPSSLSTKDLLCLLQSAASARIRLCTTIQSFLNPGGTYKINHVELNLPDAFSEKSFVDDLVFESSEDLYTNLPYFIRLLWTFADKSFNSSMDAEGPFKKNGIHTQFMFYQHDRHFSYALAFVAEYLLPLYTCLIETKQMSCTEEDMDRHSDQLPFTHVLFECMLSLMSPTYYTKEDRVKQCLRALTPILNAYGLQSIGTAITLKLETGIKNKCPLSQVGSLDSMRKAAYESIERERAEIQKLTNVTNTGCQQIIDNRLYVSSACLSFLYFALDIKDSALILALEQTILKIENPMLKLDVLTIAALTLSHSAAYKIIERTLQDRILENVRNLPKNLPPLTSCLLILRSLTVLDNGSMKKTLLLDVLEHLNLLIDETQKKALLTTAIGIQKVTCTSCPTLSYLKHHSDVQRLPYFKTSALQRVYDSNVTSKFFLSHYNSNDSIPVLFYSMYLAELSHDIQAVQTFFGKLETSKLFEDLPSTLTYARATVINEILHSAKQRPLLQNIAEQMHEVTIIEPRALHVISQWLVFSKDDQRRLFSYYGALLLCENDLWLNTTAIGIVCDLLINNDDQFRERAVALIATQTLAETSKESDSNAKLNLQTNSSFKQRNSITKAAIRRSSTVIGTEGLVILMTRWLEYRSMSTSAAFFLSQMFDTIIIDNILHLEEILKLEWQRLSDEVDNASSLKQVSLFTLLGQVSSDVLNSFIVHLSRILDHDFKIETNKTRHFFHENLLKVASVQLLKSLQDAEEKSMLCELLWRIASDSSVNEDLRLNALESLAYSESEAVNRFLFILITEHPKDFSDQLTSTAIHAYCHTVDAEALDRDVLLDLLHHRSKSISDQVRYELVLLEANLISLLDLFDNDYKECYNSLLNCCPVANRHCETILADLIESQPELLLGSFLIDLLNSMNHFISGIDQSLGHQNDILRTAILLFQKMPAATYMDGNRLDIINKLKDALYLASKHHDVSCRVSCLKLISFFKELTPDLCEMVMAAQMDAAVVKKAAEDCMLQIEKVAEGAVEKLVEYLSNDSLAIRSRAGTILVQLVLAKVLAVAPVQKAFLDAVNRMNDGETVDNRLMIMHRQFIHDLLVKMSYSNVNSVDKSEDEHRLAETPRNIDGQPVLPWNRSRTNWHLEDFKAAERSAPYGFCLISGKERKSDQDIGNMHDVSVDEIDDTDEDEDIRLALAESLRIAKYGNSHD